MLSIRGRVTRLIGGVLVASGAVVAVGVSPAAAASGTPVALNSTCHGRNIDPETGNTGTPLLPSDDPFPLPFTTAAVGGPTEVNAGTSFDGVAGTIAVPVPAQVDSKVQGVGIGGEGVVNVNAAANIIETIQVTGAATIGTPTIAGGNVIGATAVKQGTDKVVLTFPGTHNTSDSDFQKTGLPGSGIIPGEEHDFTAGTSFSSPKLTIPVTAGAAGTTIKFVFTNLQADSDADVFDNLGHVYVRAVCVPDTNVLGAVQVVTPPPPGAPDAVADVTQTDQGEAVNVDVLANDKPDAQLAIDADSLAITKNPGHGSVKVNADHTVTYTPAAGFSGSDTFTYKLCSQIEQSTTTTVEVIQAPTAVAQLCDTAKVTISVVAPQDVIVTPKTTPTTVAPAAELPKTGRTSTPLVLLGLGLCVAGLSVIGLSKPRRRTATS